MYFPITNSGEGFKKLVFKIAHAIWESEDIPDQWDLTTLHMIFKSGLNDCMGSYRYIHLKDWFPRLFEGIIFMKMKPKLIIEMSKFQIGAKPSHRAQEHLFVLKSTMALYKMLSRPLLAQFVDIQKYFDREDLMTAMDAINEAGVKGKTYRLMYKMNSNTHIQVKTPVRISDTATTGENIGQGSIPGAVASALNLDINVRKKFDTLKPVIWAYLLVEFQNK